MQRTEAKKFSSDPVEMFKPTEKSRYNSCTSLLWKSKSAIKTVTTVKKKVLKSNFFWLKSNNVEKLQNESHC